MTLIASENSEIERDVVEELTSTHSARSSGRIRQCAIQIFIRIRRIGERLNEGLKVGHLRSGKLSWAAKQIHESWIEARKLRPVAPPVQRFSADDAA